MNASGHRRLYLAQSDAYRRQWLNQRGGGDCRLTSKQNAELKTWFDFWDRDSEGEVDPRSISDALSALKVLSDSQKQEFDALVEAATDGDERRRFNYAEFRTLMTYPKCGIAKRILSVMSGQDFLKGMPFHIVVQAHNREKLIGGLMSKITNRRGEAEKHLKNVESKLLRKQRKKDAENRALAEGGTAAKKGATSPKISKPISPVSIGGGSASGNQEDRKMQIHRLHSDAVVLHSKTLFKPTVPREIKRLQFRPSDFFPREGSGTWNGGGMRMGGSKQPKSFGETAPISLQKGFGSRREGNSATPFSAGSMSSMDSVSSPYNNSFADTAPITMQNNPNLTDEFFGSAAGWAVESPPRPDRGPLETR